MAFALYNSLSNLSINYKVGFGTTTPVCPIHAVVTESHMGNVGIGTTNPLQKLHVAGGSACFMNTNVGFGVSSPAAAIDVLTTGTNALSIYQQGVLFNAINVATTYNANTFCVSGTGQVGINTANPIQALHVQGNHIVRGSIGVGLAMGTPTANLHVSGTTSGVPGVYASGVLSGTTFIFSLQPTAYKVHEIRFNYTTPTGANPQTVTLSCTGAGSTAYTANIGSFTSGSTWTALANTAGGAAPSFFVNVSANQNVNGLITIYNFDLASGFANIAVDILTPVPQRIFGNMKVNMTSGNVSEFRYTFNTPSDAVGTYTITGYPL